MIQTTGILSADDKPDFTFTAQRFFKEVGRNQSPQKYVLKIIELTGKIQFIGDKPHHLLVGERDWVSCKPDKENAGQFANLTEDQEVRLRGLGSRYGGGLEHCILISQ